MTNWKTSFEEIEIGTGRTITEGEDLAILTIGHIGNYAIEVCEKLAKQGITIGHYDLRFVKPLDAQLLHKIFSKYRKIITVEDGCIQGGFGSAILEFMADHHYTAAVKRLGIPDKIIEHGEQSELHSESGFDVESIERAVLAMLETVLK